MCEIHPNADMREVAKRLAFRDFSRAYIQPTIEFIMQNIERKYAFMHSKSQESRQNTQAQTLETA